MAIRICGGAVQCYACEPSPNCGPEIKEPPPAFVTKVTCDWCMGWSGQYITNPTGDGKGNHLLCSFYSSRAEIRHLVLGYHPGTARRTNLCSCHVISAFSYVLLRICRWGKMWPLLYRVFQITLKDFGQVSPVRNPCYAHRSCILETAFFALSSACTAEFPVCLVLEQGFSANRWYY